MSKPVESFSNSANTTSVIHEGIHENFALVLNAFASWCSYPECDEIYILYLFWCRKLYAAQQKQAIKLLRARQASERVRASLGGGCFAASEASISIKWYYEGSTSALGALGALRALVPSGVGFPIIIQTSPLTVTPTGRGKSVTVSRCHSNHI